MNAQNSVAGRKGGKASAVRFREKAKPCQLGRLHRDCDGPAVTTIANVQICAEHLRRVHEIAGASRMDERGAA